MEQHLLQPRVIRQALPDPPEAYDQAYLFRMVNALNLLMNQVTADAEWIAARYIVTAPVYVDPSGALDPTGHVPYPNTTGLPTGLIYFLRDASQPANSPQAYFATIVKGADV